MSCLTFVLCNSQLPASWTFFAAFSFRLLSLCDSFACTSRPANCGSLMELSQSSTSTNYSRFPEACLKRRNSCVLKYFGVLHQILSRRKLSCEQFFFSIFFDNFYNAFFQRRDWCIMMAYHFVCQNSFLRCGQENSVLCILLRSSMNLVIYLPRFLCVCNYFCFAGIVVEKNCTLPL